MLYTGICLFIYLPSSRLLSHFKNNHKKQKNNWGLPVTSCGPGNDWLTNFEKI